MLLDGLEHVARLDHPAVVVAVLLGQGAGEEVEVGLADDLVERQAQRRAEFLVAEREPALQVLPEDALGQALDERVIEPLRGPQGILDPARSASSLSRFASRRLWLRFNRWT